jgi:hypothetical protein
VRNPALIEELYERLKSIFKRFAMDVLYGLPNKSLCDPLNQLPSNDWVFDLSDLFPRGDREVGQIRAGSAPPFRRQSIPVAGSATARLLCLPRHQPLGHEPRQALADGRWRDGQLTGQFGDPHPAALSQQVEHHIVRRLDGLR